MAKRIILFGFGNVGRGFYRLYQSVQKHLPAEIIAIVVRHKEKYPPLPILHAYQEGTWRSAWALADIVIECTSDPVAGWDIIFSSLRAGKAVITSSKRPLAENLSTLQSWLSQNPHANLRHEAAAVASIPIFGGALRHFAIEPVWEITGVVNGTTHYILQRILREGRSYTEVLRDAQRLGYAEEDPTLDISGWDAAYKLILLVWRAMGVILPIYEVPVWGIGSMGQPEIDLCRHHHLTLKLIVQARRVENRLHVYVGPAFLPEKGTFSTLEGAENGLLLEMAWAGRQFYQGMGAGPEATGSAIIGDLAALLRGEPALPAPPAPFSTEVKGITGTFYLRGTSLLHKLGIRPPSTAEGVLWYGDAHTLHYHTRSLPPESYFVALLSPGIKTDTLRALRSFSAIKA